MFKYFLLCKKKSAREKQLVTELPWGLFFAPNIVFLPKNDPQDTIHLVILSGSRWVSTAHTPPPRILTQSDLLRWCSLNTSAERSLRRTNIAVTAAAATSSSHLWSGRDMKVLFSFSNERINIFEVSMGGWPISVWQLTWSELLYLKSHADVY